MTHPPEAVEAALDLLVKVQFTQPPVTVSVLIADFLNQIAPLYREQAARDARDALCDMEWPPQDGDALIDLVQAAIRKGE